MTSTISGSSTFAQKSSIIQTDHRSKSCDTVCSSNSSCFYRKRKPMNPLAYPLRPNYHHKANMNPVKQRVMSAKLLKLRQLQSQLNDANYHLAEIARENQTLKTMQKRQDRALSKYEDTNAELPRLLHSHEEERRIFIERTKTLKRTVKELTEQLKTKEDELNRTREQLLHLDKLNRDKNLIEREKLTEQMECLKIKLEKSDEQVNVLNRKLMLESKISRQRTSSETMKNKQLQKELFRAMEEIDRLNKLLDVKDNVVRPRKLHSRDTFSMVTLKHYQMAKQSASQEKLTTNHETAPVTDVKLEPLAAGKCDDDPNKLMEMLTLNPMENIKQRLSSSGSTQLRNHRSDNESVSLKSAPSSGGSVKLEKIKRTVEQEQQQQQSNDEQSNGDDEIQKLLLDKSVKFEDMEKLFNENHNDEDQIKDDIEETLKKLSDNLVTDAAIQRTASKSSSSASDADEEFDKNLGKYCTEVLSNVKNCSKTIDAHKKGLENARNDTDNLMRMLEETEKIESKLKQSFFNMDDTNTDYLDEILNEEFRFRFDNQKSTADDNGETSKMKPWVNTESKKKLLATLRAIDNGDNVEELEEKQESNLIKEIFGRVAH